MTPALLGLALSTAMLIATIGWIVYEEWVSRRPGQPHDQEWL